MRFRVLFIFIAAALAACTTASIRAEFDRSLEYYNKSIRWQDFDRTALFSSDPTSAEFMKRVDVAKKARVIDYSIEDIKYDEKSKEVLAKVEFSYYVVMYGTVRKVTDNQKWVYMDKSWKLTSPLPEFR